MKFPNAYSGVKKIFAAEILSVIGVIVLIVSAVLGLIAASAGIAAQSADEQTASALYAAAVGFGIPTLILMLGFGVLAIVAFILQIVGVTRASKDERTFKNALFFILVGVIATATDAITGAFSDLIGQTGLDLVSSICTNLSKIATILVTYYIIAGVIALAEKIGNEKIEKQGRTIIGLILIMLVLSLIATITSTVFQHNGTNEIIASVLALASAIIDLIAYIIYLVFLGRAKKMLREATE